MRKIYNVQKHARKLKGRKLNIASKFSNKLVIFWNKIWASRTTPHCQSSVFLSLFILSWSILQRFVLLLVFQKTKLHLKSCYYCMTFIYNFRNFLFRFVCLSVAVFFQLSLVLFLFYVWQPLKLLIYFLSVCNTQSHASKFQDIGYSPQLRG